MAQEQTMITMKKRNVALAAVAAAVVAVAIGASGSATTDTTSTTPVASGEQMLDRGAPVRDFEAAGMDTAPGYTVIRFDEAALAALAPLKPAGVAPGAFGLTASGLAVEAAFPIVAASDTVVDHAGGLTFTDGDTSLTLRGYRIDTATGAVTATAVLPGQQSTSIPFLEVALTEPAPGCDVSGDVTLAEPAANVLGFVFGADGLAGAPIGKACVTLP